MLVITNTISHYRANGHITKGGAMSREMSSLIQQLKTEQLEVKLALQCAPLIAGLKVSNLLIISKKDEFRLLALIKNSGFCAYSLLQSDDKVTFLLFNRYQLENFLAASPVLHLLSQSGYTRFSLDEILRKFSLRYEKYMNNHECFPHEMGVLLGYPIEDVKGFIDNAGKNFLYSGYWKVYANVSEKVHIFNLFDNARKDIIKQIISGTAIEDIIANYQIELQCAAV